MCDAQIKSPYRPYRLTHRIGVGVVSSFYKNNALHTINTKAKPGFCISYKSELFLGRKTNLLLGLEYFSHGVSFNGYYSAPGNTYLFDETYSYKHELRIQELQLPLAVKLAFNSEKDKPFTAYLFGGVGARYIFSSYAVITNDSTGNAVYDSKVNVDLKYRFIKGLNTFLHIGFGLQSNFRKSGGAAFFEVTYKYGISPLHYAGYKHSNDLDIKDAHLAFLVGFRF